MFRRFASAIKIILLFFSVFADTAQGTTVVVNTIPNLLNEPDQEYAPYNRLINTFDNLSVVVVPATRMVEQFNMPDINCMFPGNMETMPGKENLIQSIPVEETNAYLFSWSDNIVEPSDASVIALRRGFVYGGIRDKIDTDFIDLSTARETLAFLRLSRVDAIIGYLPDIQAAAIEEKVTVPPYNEDKPVYQSSHRFVCHDTKQNRDFIKSANKHIAEFLRQ